MATQYSTTPQITQQILQANESGNLLPAQRETITTLLQLMRLHQDKLIETKMTRQQRKILGDMMLVRFQLWTALGLTDHTEAR